SRGAAIAARFEGARRIGSLVALAAGGRRAHAIHRTVGEAIFAKVRDRLPRPARARAAQPALARDSSDLSPSRSARRDPRRPLRPGLLGRAIRAAGSGRRAARGAAAAERSGAHLAVLLRPAELRGASLPRPPHSVAAAPPA